MTGMCEIQGRGTGAPQACEQVGIFVCSGDCRNTTTATGANIKERSNVVLVKWSNSGTASYTY